MVFLSSVTGFLSTKTPEMFRPRLLLHLVQVVQAAWLLHHFLVTRQTDTTLVDEAPDMNLALQEVTVSMDMVSFPTIHSRRPGTRNTLTS